jgi:FkbM family methyltransferase
MSENYHYKIPFKTKLLNIPRRIFKWKMLEHLLSKQIQNGNIFLKKIIPPEYLYAKGSWRICKRKGLNMKLDISNVVDHEIYFNLCDRSFEQYLDGLKDIKTFFDIGANIGWTALQVKKKFPNAKIFAFEPSSKNRNRLEENISLNGTNIQIVPYGLGNELATFNLYSVLESNPGMNRILQVEKDLPFEVINVVTADSIWKQVGMPIINALKIDVEGFEMFVLKGMNELLTVWKPAIFMEVDDINLSAHGFSAKILLTWLHEKGYSVINAQSKTQLKPPFNNLPPHFDIIAK